MSKPVFLFAFANDDAQGRLNLEQEDAAAETALAKVHDQGRIEFISFHKTSLERVYGSFNRFHNRLAVFHYGGHSNRDNLSLDGGPSDTRNLAVTLGQQKHLKLVFLNGCSNADQVEQLFQHGVKSVIATSKAISDDLAIDFTKEFYDSLAAGKTLEESYKSAAAFVKDKDRSLDIPERSVTWRSSDARGIANREKPEGFAWRLFINNDPSVLQWRIPVKRTKWYYALLVLLFPLGWFLANWLAPAAGIPMGEAPPELCPGFTDSATFKIAILPVNPEKQAPEMALWDELNDLNRDHRRNHPGRDLFFSEANISPVKFNLNNYTIDSLLRTCAQMVIYGLPDSPENAPNYSVEFNARSAPQVNIDEETSLTFDPVKQATLSEPIVPWAKYLFALIDDEYFNCLDPESGNQLAEDLARRNPDEPGMAARLHIATQVYVNNNRVGDAIALFNKFDSVTASEPALIRNFGLCYVMKKDFKNASHTLMGMPATALDKNFLLFRWKVHRRAGYFIRALKDIDLLMKMENLDPKVKSTLETEKRQMTSDLDKSRITDLLAEMERHFKDKKWDKAITNANSVLAIDGKNARAAEVAMESWFNLRDWSKTRQFARKVLQLEPKHILARQKIVMAYSAENKWEPVCQQTREILKINPESYFGYYYLIKGLIALKKPDEACDVLNQAGNVLDKKPNKSKLNQMQELINLCNSCCGFKTYD